MNAELSETVRRIIGLLRQSSHAERASWILERFEVLRAPDSTPEAIGRALSELHDCVHGDDGLMGLKLKSDPGFGMRPPQSRAQLDELATKLYELTA